MNNEKINSKIKLLNNSSFVILIFVILKFRNISRSTFCRSKIGKISNGAEYRIDEQFQSFLIFGILIIF